MKRILLALVLVCLTAALGMAQLTYPSVAGGAAAANPFVATDMQLNYGALSAQDTGACSTANACVVLPLGALDQTATITAYGTWSATAQIEAQVGNATGANGWIALSCPTFSQGAAVSSFTANGGWQCDVAGKVAIRVRVSAFTSGTLNVGMASGQARSTNAGIPVPQNLGTTNTPTFAAAPQVDGIAALVQATTTTTTGTAANAITGLTWTVPASTALNYNFHCGVVYQQGTGNAAVTFSITTGSNAPTGGSLLGHMQTNTTAFTDGAVLGYTTTAATTIVSASPASTATNFAVTLDGSIEQPSSGSASIVTINVATATAADTVTISRDSFCRLF